MSKKPDNLDGMSAAEAVGTSSTPRARSSRISYGPGRTPTALTEARLTRILEAVEIGVPPSVAAMAAGVPRRTWQNWLAKGRDENAVEPYRSLADRLELAIAAYHESRVQVVHRGAEKDPRLAQWELERRFRDDWSDPDRGGVTVNLGVVLASPEWIDLRDRLLRALAGFPEALAAVTAELAGVAPAIEGELVREIEAA